VFHDQALEIEGFFLAVDVSARLKKAKAKPLQRYKEVAENSQRGL
jgi:hypothetical protein